MNDLVEFLFAEQNLIFLISGIVVLAVLAFELMAMTVGASINMLHADVGFDADHGLAAPLDWLNPGHVPFILLLTLFMGAMSVIGFTVQWAVVALGLPFLPLFMATPFASMLALPVVRGSSSILGNMLADATTAIDIDALIGHYGTVTLGPVDSAIMGQAKFTDDFGTTHYLTVVTEQESVEVQIGQQVVLLGRLTDEDNTVFLVRAV